MSEEVTFPLYVKKIGNSLFLRLTREFRRVYNPHNGDLFIIKVVKIIRHDEAGSDEQ